MGSMLQTIRNAWKLPEVRKRILFTLFALLVYRLGIAVPVPGISTTAFTAMFNRMGQFGQFMDIISGGAFSTVSILSLGIQPYINASIILQLLTAAIPSLQALSKEGEVGQKKIQKITRYVTIGISLAMSFAFWSATRSASFQGMPMFLTAIVVILSFTAGSLFVMWLGEQINDKGVGNGISLIIFIGIVSRLPRYLAQLFVYFKGWQLTSNTFVSILGVLFVVAAFIFVIALVVFVQSSERRIPVNYAKRVIGRKMYGGQSTYLPIKVNQAGVLPVIFAISILMMPSTIITFTGARGPVAKWFLQFNANPLYYLVYALLIIAFTFFYATITFNPIEIANNLQKNGGFIPGIRPGRPTSEFIAQTSHRLCWIDGIFLVVIVLLPTLFSYITKASHIWFGGTAVLIMVGVAMDIVNQLEAHLMMRHYKGFLD